MKVPIIYKTNKLTTEFRCDLFVKNCLVVELKSFLEMNSIFEAQLLTCIKFLKAPTGIKINFNCYTIFKEGQKTFTNEYFKLLS